MDDLASFRAAPRNCAAAKRVCSPRWIWCLPVDRRLYRSDGICTRRCTASPPAWSGSLRSDDEGVSFAEGRANQPRPILGYYGVIDERLDLDLLAEIADLRPDWTIALIGPVAKIDESTIPNEPTSSRFGQQAYDDLPAFLACFDVALMPFARNEATRAISPTKTLEYLAGGKPVVSTPIADVISLYGDAVEFAATAKEFIAATEAVLHRTSARTGNGVPARRASSLRMIGTVLPRQCWRSCPARARQ